MSIVQGQDRALSILQAALRSGRLHHAFVFHGPAGVGKFTVAVEFARVLLCLQPVTREAEGVQACGRCRSCELLHPPEPVAAAPGKGKSQAAKAQAAPEAARLSHPDLHVVTKELALFSDDRAVRERKLLSIPVDVLRTGLLEPVTRASQLGGRKVFIVDEAELLAPVAQNLLLKTLEEPPAGTHIILVTSSEEGLLPTIRSRCQRVAFGRLGESQVDAWLAANGQGLDTQQRRWLARFADGSIGRASLAARYSLHRWSKVLDPGLEALQARRCPSDLGAQFAGLIEDFAQQWVDDHENASKDAANRQGANLLLLALAQHGRRELQAVGVATQKASADERDAAFKPPLSMIEAVAAAEAELAANVNLSLVCDHLVSRLQRCFR